MTTMEQLDTLTLTNLEQSLLNDFQHGLPLTSRPYATIADELGVTETQVLQALERLQSSGAISRVGPVFRTHSIGVSTLAAMAVPAAQLEEVAALVNSYEAVNHNYEREHRLNLWFVATAPDQQHLDSILSEIEQRSGLSVISLPMLEDYHIDLGFELQWT